MEPWNRFSLTLVSQVPLTLVESRSYFATRTLSKAGSIVSHLLCCCLPSPEMEVYLRACQVCVVPFFCLLPAQFGTGTCPAYPQGGWGLLTDKGPRDGTFYRYSSFEIITCAHLIAIYGKHSNEVFSTDVDCTSYLYYCIWVLSSPLLTSSTVLKSVV